MNRNESYGLLPFDPQIENGSRAGFKVVTMVLYNVTAQ